jgi:hypothetical protein
MPRSGWLASAIIAGTARRKISLRWDGTGVAGSMMVATTGEDQKMR